MPSDDLPELAWQHTYAWFPVASDQVEVGDVYANSGTVTAVSHGPTLPLGTFDDLAAGEVLIRCGEGFAAKGNAGRIVIVGRRIAREADDA